MFSWLILSGIASTLIPNEGIVHEWITFVEDTFIRIEILNGIINRLSFSKSRNWFIDSQFNIYKSNS